MALRAFNNEEVSTWDCRSHRGRGSLLHLQGCSCRSTPLPYVPYRPAKTDWTLELKEPVVFSSGGKRGIPLKPSAGEAAQIIDDADFPVYSGCGPKATLLIHVSSIIHHVPKHVNHHTEFSPLDTYPSSSKSTRTADGAAKRSLTAVRRW